MAASSAVAAIGDLVPTANSLRPAEEGDAASSRV
jgi:hypothetical protein